MGLNSVFPSVNENYIHSFIQSSDSEIIIYDERALMPRGLIVFTKLFLDFESFSH